MPIDDQELSARLRRLPELKPPADGWVAVDAALRRAPTRLVVRWQAVAAALLLMLLALVMARPWSVNRQMLPLQAGNDGVETLVARSQQLEALLAQLPQRPAVEQAGTTMAIGELQARIQLLDAQLSLPADGRGEVRRLWDERVELMNSLVGVRFAEATRGDRWANTNSGEFL